MIDEETLTNLLTEHAERIPVPDHGIDALLTRSPRGDTPAVRRPPRPSARVLGIAAAVCVVAGVGIAIAHGSAHHSTTEAIATAPPHGIDGGAAGSATTTVASPAQRLGLPSGGDTIVGSGAFPTDGNTKSEATPPTTNATVTAPTDTARVIRNATLDLRIARHSFAAVVSRVTTIGSSEGGYIADANTNEAAATPSGVMTVRVPSGRFNDTVGKLRALGTVVTETTHGNDVTGQYTDLNARLSAAKATRDAYLTVLAKATNIGDILAIQDRIQGVQTQIDQLQGQINSLDNQTTYATITMSVTEPGPKAKPIEKVHHRTGLAVAWDNARDGFARRIEGLISHSGSALVILLGLLALALGLRFLVPRARRLLV
jgi:hypothetical protein